MKVNAFAADGSNTPGSSASAWPVPTPIAWRTCRCSARSHRPGADQITDPLAPTLLVARIVQSVVHLISTSALAVWIRFAAFFVQLIILIWWLLRLSP